MPRYMPSIADELPRSTEHEYQEVFICCIASFVLVCGFAVGRYCRRWLHNLNTADNSGGRHQQLFIFLVPTELLKRCS